MFRGGRTCPCLSALSRASICLLFASGVFCCTLPCSSFTCRTLIRSCRLRRHYTGALELARLRRCSYNRLAVVHGSILTPILSGLFPVLRLHGRRWCVLLVRI